MSTRLTHDEAVALWAVRSIDVQKRIETEGHGLIRLRDFATALRELARDYGLPEDWTNSGEAIGALKAARRKAS